MSDQPTDQCAAMPTDVPCPGCGETVIVRRLGDRYFCGCGNPQCGRQRALSEGDSFEGAVSEFRSDHADVSDRAAIMQELIAEWEAARERFEEVRGDPTVEEQAYDALVLSQDRVGLLRCVEHPLVQQALRLVIAQVAGPYPMGPRPYAWQRPYPVFGSTRDQGTADIAAIETAAPIADPLGVLLAELAATKIVLEHGCPPNEIDEALQAMTHAQFRVLMVGALQHPAVRRVLMETLLADIEPVAEVDPELLADLDAGIEHINALHPDEPETERDADHLVGAVRNLYHVLERLVRPQPAGEA